MATLNRFVYYICFGLVILLLTACHPITKPMDASMMKYQPANILRPLESYRLRYQAEQGGEKVVADFAWTRTNQATGFDLFSYGLFTSPSGTISGIEVFVGSQSYEWVAGDPNLGIWSVYERATHDAVAMLPGNLFDFADPETWWNLPISEIALSENLIGIEEINGLRARHYYSDMKRTELWVSVDEKLIVKFVVYANELKTHRLRSFEIYDVNQPVTIKPPLHAQWLVDAMAQGSIHFPGCQSCIFPIPPKTVQIARSQMTNGRDLQIATQWFASELEKYLEEKLLQYGWEIQSRQVTGTTWTIMVADGEHEFQLSILPAELNDRELSLNYLSIVPVDINDFPIVLDEM